MPITGKYRIVLDQMGVEVRIPQKPMRIISLVPSQTEWLYDIGLGHCLIGKTRFCVHPKKGLEQALIIGGTKKLHLQRIRELQPNLIIGNKEENEKAQIEALRSEFPVWMSDISTLDEALLMMRQTAEITGQSEVAAPLIERIASAFSNLPEKRKGSALYLIWREPWMGAGHQTYIHDMLHWAGYDNVLAQSRYPELSLDDIVNLSPEHILLSSEPYPFKEKHIAELQEILPLARIVLVDGELFSWYGSRLLQAAPYLKDC
jgi:ABC-type Fe3+-hydroxamate transport system substrate-binding protein